MKDDPNNVILARRARFVAAALAGVGVACGKDPAPPPEPCLSVVPVVHRDADPSPGLDPRVEPSDAPPAAGFSDAGGAGAPLDAGPAPSSPPDAGRAPRDVDAGPTPCLAPRLGPRPQPTPCLAPPLPKKGP